MKFVQGDLTMIWNEKVTSNVYLQLLQNYKQDFLPKTFVTALYAQQKATKHLNS